MKEISKETIEQWKILRKQGLNCREISRRYNVDYFIVLRRFKNIGLTENKFYKKKYVIAFYDKNGKLAFSFNNVSQLTKTFPEQKATYSFLSHYLKEENRCTMAINEIPYYILFVNHEKPIPDYVDVSENKLKNKVID